MVILSMAPLSLILVVAYTYAQRGPVCLTSRLLRTASMNDKLLRHTLQRLQVQLLGQVYPGKCKPGLKKGTSATVLAGFPVGPFGMLGIVTYKWSCLSYNALKPILMSGYKGKALSSSEFKTSISGIHFACNLSPLSSRRFRDFREVCC